VTDAFCERVLFDRGSKGEVEVVERWLVRDDVESVDHFEAMVALREISQ
jgi:hypothetical protein